MSVFFRHCAAFLAVASVYFLCECSCQANEARIWTSKGGKHEIRAKFVDVKDGKVRLERPNGDISRIPLTKLSEDDQQYIRNLVRNGPSKPPRGQPLQGQPPRRVQPSTQSGPRGLAVGDPIEAESFNKWKLGTVSEIDYKWKRVRVRFEGDSGNGRRFSLRNLRLPGTSQQPLLIKPVDPALADLKTVRPDMSDVIRVVAGGSTDKTVPSDPRSESSLSWKPRAIRLQPKESVHERLRDFAVVIGEKPMALVLRTQPGFGDEDPAMIEILDLQKRKAILSGPTLPGTNRVLVSPSGRMIATAHGGHGADDSAGQLHLWKLTENKVDHVVQFSPYVMDSWPNAEPKWIEWLDDEHLFTSNNEGRVILWQIEGAKAVYELMIDRGTKPILSPGRKQLAVGTVGGVQIYSAKEGDLLANVGSGNLRHAALTFSPSGRQLAAVSGGFVDVIDVTTGQVTRSFPCKDLSTHQGASWIDEEYLYAGSLLVNVPRRIIAWKFEVGSSLFRTVGKTHWLLVDGHQSQILSPLEMPPPEAVAAVSNLQDEELLAVQPGATVSIDVRINNHQLASDVEKALFQALEEAGMTVGEGGPLTLGATMKNGESVTINYRRFGEFRGSGETISVNQRIYELQLLLDGVPIWKRTSVQSPPHHLRMEKGESIRSAVARLMKPHAASFRGRLPAYVVRPEYQDPLGSSRVTP